MGAFGTVIPVTGLNLGFAGQISRTGERVIAARQGNSSNAHNINFGQSVVLLADSTGGTYESVTDFIAGGGTMTAALFAGVAIREVKTLLLYNSLVEPNTTQQLGSYVPGEETEVLERGSIVVAFDAGTGTPQAGKPVFLRTALNGAFPNGVVGGFEAQADGGNTISLASVGVVFRTGVVDANSNVEITMLNRVAA